MFKPISRQTMLRGLGVTMGLPWLESMTPTFGSQTLEKPPVRSAFMFMPNGVWPKYWDPQGEGESYECHTPFLKHFENLKNDFILLENLWHEQTVGRNGHWPKVPAFLSGGYVEKSTGRDMNVGHTSLDQVMAQSIGYKTPLPSLELSLDRSRSDVDHAGGGFAKVYGNHIAWRDSHTPVPGERVPLMAFNRLFKTRSFPKVKEFLPKGTSIADSLVYDDSSILDLVRDDAKALQRKISLNDRDKIDEYFESVRATELQIKNSIMPQKRWMNKEKFDFDKPENGIPKDHEQHIKLMLDIMLLAFWTDSTRVSTFMFGNAQSDRAFSFLAGVKGSFHGISHHREDPKVLEQYIKIIHFHMKQMSYFLEKMKSMNEGENSLLDNSMVFFGSSIKDGNKHSEKNLPLILAGKGGGHIKTGRRMTFPKETPLCNLFLTMSKIMGLNLKKFGDSKAPVILS